MRAILVSLLLILAPGYAFSSTVKAVKGKKVLVDLGGDKAAVGDIFRVMGEGGKAKGLLKIKSVKSDGSTAVGVLKGKAEAGDALELKNKTEKKSASQKSKSSSSGGSAGEMKKYIGFMAGYNMATADVTVGSGATEEKVSLDGTGFSAKAVVDYQLFSKLWFRGLGGLEQLNLGGDTSTECAGECIAEINYLALDFWGRVVFGGAWVGAGFDLMFPLSKDVTALKESSVTSTSIVGLGGGYDIKLGSGSIMPIQFEYNIYPPTEKVKATTMAIRIGYAFSF